MALRYRRVKEISRFLLPVYSGDCYQHSGQAFNFMDLSVMSISSTWKPITRRIQDSGLHAHRFSTMTEVSHEPAPETELLSFTKASVDDLEGTHHCWLNRFEKNKQLFGEDGTFLILAARILDHDLIAKLKTLQQRFPDLCVMGLQSIHSPADHVNLVQLLMTENVTVPILLSKKTFHEMDHGMCYILSKNFRSPVIYQDKDLDLEILSKAVEELNMQPNGVSESFNKLFRPSWKPVGITKEQYICPYLQNLLLFYPGCVSADECGNHLFLSDCNHHRIIVSDGNGEILDCIGSSPGFEDGDFGSAKLRHPAGSYYNDAEDCLYFVDSENHAIRKADMGARLVETLYPSRASKKGSVGIWTWIMNTLGLKGSWERSVDEHSEVLEDSKSLYLPWHLMKSGDDTLLIMNHRFRTLWTMDLDSGKINEVFEGSPEILKIYGQQIKENLSLLDQMPEDWFQQQTDNAFSLEDIPYSGLLSSMTTLQNHIILCDAVGQRILKIGRESGICSTFQFSNLAVLGLPYWLTSPLETVYAAENGLSGVTIDHQQDFRLLPGRVDIQLYVDIPRDTELVEPLEESCIWRQARGAATEISGMEDVPGSLEKVGVAQQWYDELDHLASPKAESEMSVEDVDLNKNLMVEDKKAVITCSVNTSPGTSEVIIYAVMYLKLRKDPNSKEHSQENHAARMLDIVSSRRCGKTERDLWKALLLKSKGDLRDLIFMKLLHIRIKLNCPDHPKAENGRDIILTDSSIEVNVSLN
ncbi:hypothetical protein L6164_003270 [Bauhinia variegata]|uniref:Uncharacterized protein n=1 Tax=Bauhinia variegata TaxID=167791 RepID=A0ACB9Q0Y9_BAUVA|nr:hypothetical protein L6164_003270 [Bauhinia variegata]